jgi:hypothetical protein
MKEDEILTLNGKQYTFQESQNFLIQSLKDMGKSDDEITNAMAEIEKARQYNIDYQAKRDAQSPQEILLDDLKDIVEEIERLAKQSRKYLKKLSALIKNPPA